MCGFCFFFLALSVSKKFMYCCGSLGVAKLRYLIFGYNVTAYARKMIVLKNLSEVFILDCIVIPTASNED